MQTTYKEKTISPTVKFREIIIFEHLTGHAFAGDTAEEMLQLYYAAVIKALGYQPPVDEFLDWVEEKPEDFATFVKENFNTD